jgi:hypothetical protein
MDLIPNEPGWAFVVGFITAEILMIILWVVIEWIGKGVRRDDD